MKRRKKTVVIVPILVACFIVAGIFAGITLTTNSDATEEKKVTKVVKTAEDDKKEKINEDVTKEATGKENAKGDKQNDVDKSKKEEKKNNSTSSPSDNKDSSSTSSTSKPTVHTHKYVAKQGTDYEERQIIGNKCNSCGYTTTGKITPHMEENWKTCGSYSTGVVIGSEVVPVTYTYYQCSCGDMHY